MDFMNQIELWNQNNEQQRIIDAIEALPENERTPQLISILARAYNNLAEDQDAPELRKAIALLESVQDDLQNDYYWNFRMAYAYYYLDQEGPALHYFQKALELNPEDEETQGFIEDCLDRLALPQFEKPFSLRVKEGWAAFLEGEAALRSMMDNGLDSGQLMERCREMLAPAFADLAFQLGFNGEKYELVLSPEGSRAKLFQLVYFQRHAPAEVLKSWNIWVGRQPSKDFCLRVDGQAISSDDVLVWIGKPGNDRFSLSFYCEKLLPLLREDEGEAYWLLSVLLDQTIGELSAMELVDEVQLLDTPASGPSVSLKTLLPSLQEQGWKLILTPGQFLEQYTAYEMEPVENEDSDLRLDIFAGVTRCPSIINEYLQGRSGLMDYFHQDGAVPGFIYYPLDGFADMESKGKAILDLRDSVETAILQDAGEDAVVFIGGASGVYFGYLDFIAWDLPAVLKSAAAHFERLPISWAAFHSFRRDVGSVALKTQTESSID